MLLHFRLHYALVCMHNFQIFRLWVQSQTIRFLIPHSTSIYRVRISMRFCYKVQSMSMRTFENIWKRHKHSKDETISLWLRIVFWLGTWMSTMKPMMLRIAILLELKTQCSKKNETHFFFSMLIRLVLNSRKEREKILWFYVVTLLLLFDV